MANIHGDQGNGTFNYGLAVSTSDALYKRLREESKAQAPTRDPDGRGGRYFPLPYKTEAEKEAVHELLNAWKQEVPMHIQKNQSEYLQPIMNRLGGKAIYNPAGEFDGYVFRNVKTNPADWAPAADRFKVAQDVVAVKANSAMVHEDINRAVQEDLEHNVENEVDDSVINQNKFVKLCSDPNLRFAREEVKAATLPPAWTAEEMEDRLVDPNLPDKPPVPLQAVYLRGVGTIVTTDATLSEQTAEAAIQKVQEIARKAAEITIEQKAQAIAMLEVIDALELGPQVYTSQIGSAEEFDLADIDRSKLEDTLRKAKNEYQAIVRDATTPLPSEAKETEARKQAGALEKTSPAEALKILQEGLAAANDLRTSTEEREAIASREAALEKITWNGKKAFNLQAAVETWKQAPELGNSLDAVTDTTNTRALDQAAGHERTMEIGGYIADDDIVKMAEMIGSNQNDVEAITRALTRLHNEKELSIKKLMYISPSNPGLTENMKRANAWLPVAELGQNKDKIVVEEADYDVALNSDNEWKWVRDQEAMRRSRDESKVIFKAATLDNVTLKNGNEVKNFRFLKQAEHFLQNQGENRSKWAIEVRGPATAVLDFNDGLPGFKKNPSAFIDKKTIITAGVLEVNGSQVVVFKQGKWGTNEDQMRKALEGQISYDANYKAKDPSIKLGAVPMPNGMILQTGNEQHTVAGQDPKKVYWAETARQGQPPTQEQLFAAAESARQKEISDRATNAMLKIAKDMGININEEVAKLRSAPRVTNEIISVKHALANAGIYAVRPDSYESKAVSNKVAQEEQKAVTAHPTEKHPLTEELEETQRSIDYLAKEITYAKNKEMEADSSADKAINKAAENNIKLLEKRLQIEIEALETISEKMVSEANAAVIYDTNRDDDQEDTKMTADLAKKATSKGIEADDFYSGPRGQHIENVNAEYRNRTIKGEVIDFNPEAMLVHEISPISGRSAEHKMHHVHIIEYPPLQAKVVGTEINGLPNSQRIEVGKQVAVRFESNVKDAAGIASVEIIDEKLAIATKQVLTAKRNAELLSGKDEVAADRINQLLTERIGPQMAKHGFTTEDKKPPSIVFVPPAVNHTSTGACYLVKQGPSEVVVQVINEKEARETGEAKVRIYSDEQLVNRMKTEVDGAAKPRLTGAIMTIANDKGRAVVVQDPITRADLKRIELAQSDRAEVENEISALAAAMENSEEAEESLRGNEVMWTHKGIDKPIVRGAATGR